MSNEFIVRNGLVSKGNIDLLGNALTTTVSNGDVFIQPNGSGKVRLGNLKVPNTDGTSGQILGTDGAGNLTWYNAGAGEANTAAAMGGTADGSSIVGPKSGTTLQFKRIKAGTNVSITDETNDVMISVTGLSTVATTGQYNDLLGKPSLATVATTGNYNDLLNKPAAGATNLDGLTDVVITSPATGHTLRYNGTSFVNAQLAATDVSGISTVGRTGNYADLSNLPVLGTAASKDVGTSSGQVPVLDVNGKLPESTLPALSITEVYVVANTAARNALSVQTGDVAIQTDVNISYIYDGSAWQELKAQAAASVVSVNGFTGAVTLGFNDLSGTLGVSKGGTGLTSVAANNLLVGNGTSAMSVLAPASGYLYWNGSAYSWQTPPASGISSVQADTAPKLGGNLDTNGFSITSTNNQTISATNNIALNPGVNGFVQIGGVDFTGKKQVSLTNNVTTATSIFAYAAASNEVILVDYVVRRGTNTRAGTITIINDGTNVAHSDAGPEIGDCGVTFTVSISDGNVNLNYQTTDTGTGASMTYYLRKMDA